VGQEYHLANGEQLVFVEGGPLEVAGLPLTIVIREPADQGGDITAVDGKGVLYRLCGLGPKCAIASGKPSIERYLLIRREALELALYTFRYTDADNVVAFLPPAHTRANPTQPTATGTDAQQQQQQQTATDDTVTQALYFRRSDVEDEVSRPLSATLTRTVPKVSTINSSADAGFVDQITKARLFDFSFTQANQDDRALLVLDPVS
jgi:hypothetical protein